LSNIMPKQTKLKRSATLDNVLEYYVKTLSNSDPNYNKFAVEGQLRNLRSQCSNDPEAIYDELEQSYPLYGYPLNLFEDCFEEEPLLAEQARKSAEKVRKEAAKVQVKAAAEFDNRLKCAELEQTKRNVEANTSELTTKAPEKRSEVDSSDSLLLTCGTFVSVKQDLSVGMCSYGGRGWVTEVSGEGETMIATVEYLKNEPGVSEANIPFQRISIPRSPMTIPTSADEFQLLLHQKQPSPNDSFLSRKRLKTRTVGRDAKAGEQRISVWRVQPEPRGGKLLFTISSNLEGFVPMRQVNYIQSAEVLENLSRQRGGSP
jgi:hypothetical protein